MTNYWIFLVVDHKTDDKIIKAMDVLKDRVKEKFWSLNKGTGNFNRIKKDDKVIFYVGGRDGKKFAGRCTLGSEPYPLRPEQKKLITGYPSLLFDHVVSLKSIELWDEPLPVEDVKEELDFIKKKDLWRAYFRRSIITISKKDHDVIISYLKPNSRSLFKRKSED
ncbi:MAG: EVE domain-containing protein [archaeon]|nr:EVE domain-containing protein [archaeon]MCP8306161.1 EVE domain-containing protein [archaeon]